MRAPSDTSLARIATGMVDHYLGDVTTSWFNEHDLPPDDIREYVPLMLWMKRNATNHGGLEALRVALGYLLTAPDVDLEQFAGSRYPFSAADIEQIVRLAYHSL